MYLATDLVRVVATPADARANRLATKLGMTVVVRSTRIIVYEQSRDCSPDRHVLATLRQAGFVRLFEGTFMRASVPNLARSPLVCAFFDLVSDRYSKIIHPEINVACYDHLLDVASHVTQCMRYQTCLDLGCGPGTILHSRVQRAVDKIFGYDLSPHMRRLAAQRGLSVFTSDQFWGTPQKLELVLSSYVLHYGTASRAFLECVAHHLDASGVWVANFHKSIGLEDFLTLVTQTSKVVVVQGPSESPFGSVLAMSRAS